MPTMSEQVHAIASFDCPKVIRDPAKTDHHRMTGTRTCVGIGALPFRGACSTKAMDNPRYLDSGERRSASHADDVGTDTCIVSFDCPKVIGDRAKNDRHGMTQTRTMSAKG
jgi:hypothetical protein